MDLIELPIDWPSDPNALRQRELVVLRMAAFEASLSPRFVEHLTAGDRRVRDFFLSEVARHWPPGLDRPGEVVQLIERFGEPAP
jgi:hypothetical protein